MDWMESIREAINKGLGALIGVLVGILAFYLKKVPKYIIEKLAERRNRRVVNAVAGISDEFDTIEQYSHAIYNHVIEYTNGEGAIDTNKEMRMTVKLERRGHVCSGCMSDCPFRKARPSIKHELQGIELSLGWKKIIRQTINAKDDFSYHHIDMPDKLVSEEVKDIWKKYRMAAFRETVIKHTKKGFLTLGLYYCSRFKEIDVEEGVLLKSVRKLKDVL